MYHLTPDGPKTCTATIGQCKYGKPVNHFDNIADAQRFYEKKMFEENGRLHTTTKKSLSERKALKALEPTGKDKTIADFKKFKEMSKTNKPKAFVKNYDHVLTPVSAKEKREVQKIQAVLKAFAA